MEACDAMALKHRRYTSWTIEKCFILLLSFKRGTRLVGESIQLLRYFTGDLVSTLNSGLVCD
jgi:hypothetical protein